ELPCSRVLHISSGNSRFCTFASIATLTARSVVWRTGGTIIRGKRICVSQPAMEPKYPPVRTRAGGHTFATGPGSPGYCLSYTAVLVTFFPFESVPLVVTVRLLPSAETTMRPVVVTLPPFLTLNDSVWSLTFVYDRVSELGSPVTG